MPFIDVKVSENLSEEKISKIKSRLGKAISLIPGKSESYLMVNISDGCNLFFKGTNDRPASMTDVSIFGSASRSACESLTEEICNILSEEAQIPSDRSYVKYRFVENWGYDGYMF